jgi:hypothetical protein
MKLGWAFLVVLVLGLAAYALNRGLYVGSEVHFSDGFYKKQCRYLFPSGVVTMEKGNWDIASRAQNEFCRLFHD